MRWRHTILIAVLWLVLVLVSGSLAASVALAPARVTVVESSDVRQVEVGAPATIKLQPCTVGSYIAAECGVLTVYENRSLQSGRTVDLRVAVVRARAGDRAPDPIFWLAGGPGASAIEDIPFAMLLLGEANRRRDLVFVDQRGTGDSHKLTCRISPVGISPEGDARAAEELKACLAKLDGDAAAYTTAWAMDDLDDVRAALGYEQINLYGGSYGPTAAQVYMQRHAEHVRTATFTSASLLDVPLFEWMPRSSQQALEVVFRRCEADGACSAAFPNVRAEFAALLARVDSGAVQLPARDPDTGQALTLTRAAFNNGLHNKLLMDTQTQRLLPRLIHAAYGGDWSQVLALAEASARPGAGDGWQIMSMTILCHEPWARMRVEETERAGAGSYMGYADVRNLTVPEVLCPVMPRPPAAAIYAPLATSSAPVLFLNGEADPQDGPATVAAAKAHYPNSLTLIAPGQSHNYTGISCRASIIAHFIAEGSSKGLDGTCLQMPPPAFDCGKRVTT